MASFIIAPVDNGRRCIAAKGQQILSTELQFTTDLKLTNQEENVKAILDRSVKPAEILKEELGVKEISYPNDYVFASLAIRAYEERKNNLFGKRLDQTLGNWQLLTVAFNDLIKDRYVGAAYWNPDMQQIIIAHRGTDTSSLGSFFSILYFNDIKGVYFNQHSPQIDSAVTFTDKIISIVKRINQEKKTCIQLFFTGHSLGGWLAQITAFTAKYLIRDGVNFIENENFEKTGCHTKTVVFESPGAKNMLERIQDKFLSRCGSSRINYLDIISYLSAPNLVNACNLHVGVVYRIIVILSEQEKQEMKKILAGYTRQMHKKERFRKVLNPNTCKTHIDKGKLIIEKVSDWPLLTSGNEETTIWDKIIWGTEQIAYYVPLSGWIIKVGKYVYSFYSIFKQYEEVQQELNSFFMSANEYNNYHLTNEDMSVEKSPYRSIRYKTEKLHSNYKNECSLNAFTGLERQFLETYKLLENHQEELPDEFKFKNLFLSLTRLQRITMEMLKDCNINNGVINSKKLQEFIPFIKRMLHFFPKMKIQVEEAQKNLPLHILSTFYKSISSSCVKSIKNPLEFENDNLRIGDFFRDNNSKILYTAQSSTSLGTAMVYTTLRKIENCYNDDMCHGIFSLSRISYVGNILFISFLKKIKKPYLLVVECDSDEGRPFLEKLFNILQNNHNIKAILVTEKESDLYKFIRENDYVVRNKSICREESSKVQWNDLTTDSQKKLLEKVVIFQGKEVLLSKVININNSLDIIIDSETISELFKSKRIEIGDPFLSLVEIESYYINRKLVKKVKVKKEILKDNSLTDLFAISNISKKELLQLVNREKVRNFKDKEPDRSNPIRFITLNETAENDFKNLCEKYSNHTIHWLKKSNNEDLIWQRSHGKTLSGLRRYIENYERDLLDSEYSEDNTAIKMIDVDDISKFNERLIVVAAEPGMGKTTALTHLGTQNNDDSKWLIRMNLVEYKIKLEQVDFSDITNIVTFLHENNFVSNTLAKNMLESRLNNSGNICFLLDGFDEITFKGQKSVVNLIKKLQETKVEKIIITTRLHLRNELENSLSMVAYALKPFSLEDQKQFLKKFWQKNLNPSISLECLENYINKLLKFISESIVDKESRFMGIPLQMKMVAEVFQEVTKDRKRLQNPECTFPENFDMLKLYDRFLYTKYQVYFGKRGAENIDLDHDKDWLTTEPTRIHRILALHVLFPEMVNCFCDKNLLSDIDEQSVNLVGIVQYINDKIVFTHRTFAEYFVADFLADRLLKNKDTKEYEITIKFLAKELFENKNNVIKTFLDYHLAKDEMHASILKGKLNDLILSEDIVKSTDAIGRSIVHYAAQEGHKKIIVALINKCDKADIIKPDELGKTALHYAARYNHGTEVVSFLLKNAKACINAKDKNGHTAVYCAAQKGNWDIVDCILGEKGASDKGLDKEKLLFHYAYGGNFNNIKNMIKDKKDVNTTKDGHDNTLLHITAQKGHLKIVDYLLKIGADVDIANNSGKRPISYAAEKEHWDIVVSLLRKNANFNDLSDTQKLSLLKNCAKNAQWDIVKLFMQDNSREDYFNCFVEQQKVELLCNIIHFKALDYKNLEIAKFLIERGTIVNSYSNGKKPIHYATKNKHWNIVELLLKKGADLNDLKDTQKNMLFYYSTQNSNWYIVKFFMRDDDYFDKLDKLQKINCLYYLISIGDLNITTFFIEKLLEKGLIRDVSTPNGYGKTILHLAAEAGNLDLVKYLVDKKGAKLDVVTNNGSTPMHLAAGKGYPKIVKYLIDKKAIANAKDHNNKMPLDLALEKNHLEIVVYLIENVAEIYFNQNKFDEAQKLYQEAFSKRSDVLGSTHPSTLMTRQKVALMLFKQCKHNEAYNVYKDVFDSQLDVLGPDDPDTLSTKYSIAQVLFKQCKYEEAYQVFKEVFDIKPDILGPNHVIMYKLYTAPILLKQGKCKEAYQVYEEVFEIQKKLNSLGPEHSDTLITRSYMAVLLSDQSRYEEAYHIYKEVFAIQEKELGPHHPDTLNTQYNVAEMLFKQNKHEDAYQVFKEMFEKRSNVLGPDHIDTLLTQQNMAAMLFRQNKYEEALQVFTEIYNIQKVKYPDNKTTGISLENIQKLQKKLQSNVECSIQ